MRRVVHRFVPVALLATTLTVPALDQAASAGPLAPLPNVVQVVPGVSHTLARASSGLVYAWGDNSKGEAGLMAATTQQETPASVTGITNVSAIASSGSTSIALRSDGTVWTWGSNFYGTLGSGGTDSNRHPTPTKVAALTGIQKISGLANAAFALAADGTVWGWGSNYGARLCKPSALQTYELVPAKIGPFPSAVREVVPGLSGTFFILQDGSVWGCGDNRDYIIPGAPAAEIATPTPIIGLSGVVSMTGVHPTAVLSDGRVMIWGWQYQYTLSSSECGTAADPTARHCQSLKQKAGISDAVEVSGNSHATFARTADGKTYVWGTNGSDYPFGDGTTSVAQTPRHVPVHDANQLPAQTLGRFFSTTGGDATAKSWGYNGFGAMGDGTTTTRSTPVTAVAPTPDAPTSVVAYPRDGAARVTFNRPPATGLSILGYTVVASPGGASQDFPFDSNDLTVTGLTNGVSYTFQVKARNAVGESASSSSSNAVTPGSAPTAPTNVVASEVQPAPMGYGDKKSATVSWTASTTDGFNAIHSYVVSWSGGSRTVCATCTSAVLWETLNATTSYTFRVVAVNAVGSSANGTASPFTTTGVGPAPPRAVTVQWKPGPGTIPPADSVSAQISWTAPISTGTSPLAKYRVVVYDGNNDTIVQTSECASCLTMTLHDLALNYPYYVAVQAVSTLIEGGTSCSSVSTTPLVPGGPAGVATGLSQGCPAMRTNTSATATSASSTSWFERRGVVNVADTWYTKERPSPFGPHFDSNCTNFLSTTWFYGTTLNMTPDWFIKEWRNLKTWQDDQAATKYHVSGEGDERYWITTWTTVNDFVEYMVNDRKIATLIDTPTTVRVHRGTAGDPIEWDLGTGSGWGHLDIAVGYDQLGPGLDQPVTWKYPADRVDANTTNWYHAPWNRAIYMAKPARAQKMRARVVHVLVGDQGYDRATIPYADPAIRGDQWT